MKNEMKSLTHAAVGLVLASGVFAVTSAWAENRVQVVPSYHNDVSRPLWQLAAEDIPFAHQEREAAENPKLPNFHKDSPDTAVQHSLLHMLAPSIPAPILNFDGIPYPGVGCSCAPPDTNGEVGATQFVQMVNEGYQVFNKSTGASVLGPASISSLWSGFGGVCQSSGFGDPVVLYDQLANRWVITQFAGSGSTATDECVAVSTTSDATGTYNRYGFHLGSNFFDYPKLAVWPDGYYMSMNVFNSAGTIFLGPQPFALNRTAMLAGSPATFVAPVGALGGSVGPILPADVDGTALPASGAPETFVGFPTSGHYTVYHFHVDFAVPSNSTWTTFATPTAAGFTSLCPSTRACVPQSGETSSSYVDGIGDRLMFRLPYRNFGDHESIVGNFTVNSGGVAGIRWFEMRNVTAGPVTLFQESTYQPDSTWRWMGSIAMDAAGNIGLGFNASSSSIHPQIRYTGRLATDPINTMTLGEGTIINGNGSQSGTSNRWGDYSAMTVDPSDDTTMWFTGEYYSATSSFNWRTRVGNFQLAAGGGTPDYSLSISPSTQSIGKNGGTLNYTVTIAPVNGFNSLVTLSISGLPSGTTGSFAPNPATTSSTLTLAVASSTRKGTYTFTATGVGGTPPLTHTATANFKKTTR
jgi:hypothetical protein